MINSTLDLANATHAELAAAGFTVITKKSQAKTRRSTKSAWGVKPRMNNARHGAPVKATNGSEVGSKIQN